MTGKKQPAWTCLALLSTALWLPTVVGCQTQIAGQTLPSAHYLRDDIEYFTKGPEFKLYRQAEALEQYNAGLNKDANGPAPANTDNNNNAPTPQPPAPGK
ncbi:MAG: hypothetical protein U0903_22105 [Planctomycetales bacterium]